MKKLSEIEIDKFSKKILEDYDNKCPGTIFKSEIKLSNEDGLLIQSKVTKLRMGRGEKVIGYKIGCVSKDTQTKMGFNQPASGTLWESEIFHSGVELEKKNYSNPAMEAEFGIRLNRDIDPKLVSFNYILESIHYIYPLIEIHNLIFNGKEPYGAELLANNALHAGVILGQENKVYDNIITDLKLIYDNEIVDSWSDKQWPNDMISEIEWLVKEQAKLNNILKKDDLILTGAYGFPVPIKNKNLIQVMSSAFGNVDAKFI